MIATKRSRLRPHRGNGYATEAARAVVDWVFSDLELTRITYALDRPQAASPSR